MENAFDLDAQVSERVRVRVRKVHESPHMPNSVVYLKINKGEKK